MGVVMGSQCAQSGLFVNWVFLLCAGLVPIEVWSCFWVYWVLRGLCTGVIGAWVCSGVGWDCYLVGCGLIGCGLCGYRFLDFGWVQVCFDGMRVQLISIGSAGICSDVWLDRFLVFV